MFDQIINRKNTNSVKWDEVRDPEMLPLWVADMDFATAPCIQEAIVKRAAHGCYGYTLVPDSYYQAIHDWFLSRHQWNIDKDSILYTIGVIPAIAAALKAICQTGDNVVLLTPVYNCFFNLVRNAGCREICVPLIESVKDSVLHFQIDWKRLEEALRHEKTTTLLISNPHNPVGRIWNEEELNRLADLCLTHHVTLISDEIHNELTAPDRTYVPFGRVMAERREKGMVNDCQWLACGSPSKSFNIAGLQNAFIICNDQDLRRRIDRAINLNETCDVNPFGVIALEAAYREGGEWLDNLRSYIFDNYRYACEQLSVVPGLKIADLQATYLMWVDCRTICDSLGIDSEELSHRLRIDAHVWFSAGSMYGSDGEGFLRINLACPRATLTEALKRFVQFLTSSISAH